MPSVPSPATCTAILVAAGASQRMGFDKLAWLLDGVPVLQRSLDALLATPSITAVIVVCPPDRWNLLDQAAFAKPVWRVDGGATRQASVACGLAAIAGETGLVAVHDAARPLVAPADIERCVAAAAACGAASLARPVADTMFRSDEQGLSAEPVRRDDLWCMETPQVFDLALLRRAYAMLGDLLVTDEVSAVYASGVRVQLVASSRSNLKITTPADLALAQALLHLTA